MDLNSDSYDVDCIELFAAYVIFIIKSVPLAALKCVPPHPLSGFTAL